VKHADDLAFEEDAVAAGEAHRLMRAEVADGMKGAIQVAHCDAIDGTLADVTVLELTKLAGVLIVLIVHTVVRSSPQVEYGCIIGNEMQGVKRAYLISEAA
jgi:hypothetical protein